MLLSVRTTPIYAGRIHNLDLQLSAYRRRLTLTTIERHNSFACLSPQKIMI